MQNYISVFLSEENGSEVLEYIGVVALVVGIVAVLRKVVDKAEDKLNDAAEVLS